MVREEMVEVQHELAGSKAELDSARVELTDLTGTLSQTQQELAVGALHIHVHVHVHCTYMYTCTCTCTCSYSLDMTVYM